MSKCCQDDNAKCCCIDENDIREKIAKEIESIEIRPSIENAIGVKIMAVEIARGI
jgi:hypothetical protein